MPNFVFFLWILFANKKFNLFLLAFLTQAHEKQKKNNKI